MGSMASSEEGRPVPAPAPPAGDTAAPAAPAETAAATTEGAPVPPGPQAMQAGGSAKEGASGTVAVAIDDGGETKGKATDLATDSQMSQMTDLTHNSRVLSFLAEHETAFHATCCGCGGDRVYADARQRVAGLVGFAISALAFLPPLIVDQAGGGEGAVTEVAAFFERDPMLSQRNDSSEVPDWLLFVLALVIPSVFIPTCQRALRVCHERELADYAAFRALLRLDPLALFLRFLTAFGWTMAITFMLKLYCGRLRPNFFASCNYAGYADAINSGDETQYLSETVAGAFGDYGKCEFPNDEWRSAQKSFPSGHASLSFAGLTWMGYYSALVVRACTTRGHVLRELAVVPFAACLVGAFLIAGSRVRDHHHHYADITAGACIGFAVATGSVVLSLAPAVAYPATPEEHFDAHAPPGARVRSASDWVRRPERKRDTDEDAGQSSAKKTLGAGLPSVDEEVSAVDA